MISFSSFFICFVSCLVSFSSSLVVLSVSFFTFSESLEESFALSLALSTVSWALSSVISSFLLELVLDEDDVVASAALFSTSFASFSSGVSFSPSETVFVALEVCFPNSLEDIVSTDVSEGFSSWTGAAAPVVEPVSVLWAGSVWVVAEFVCCWAVATFAEVVWTPADWVSSFVPSAVSVAPSSALPAVWSWLSCLFAS